jgi:two-component system, OmpR family, response regulator ChvI
MTGKTPNRLVLVDDDELLREVLAGNLAQAGYEVQVFPDPALALDAIPGIHADLLILDWKMPNMSGLELLQALRGRGVTTRALFFTSHNDTIYEEAALALGAADFVDKTRSFAILERRISMVLHHGEEPRAKDAATPGELVAGALTLTPANHAAAWRNQAVELTFGEYRVVELLATSGRDLSYREIYDALRGENFIAGEGPDGYRANVRALIKRIREKFLTVDPDFAAIANYPGFGYRWTAETTDA